VISIEPGKGHRLEQQIAAFLGQHGYAVSTNLRAQGRSGAIHELDVVGDKSDGLTSFRLVVECKAWTSAIDKEVVYKLAAELADLGAARGIIVTPSGWTVQAGQAAAQANIELWGPNELRSRFGGPALEQFRFRQPEVGVMGTQFTVSYEAALQTLRHAAHGRLGFGRDEMAWCGQLWLPVWILQIAVTREEGTFRKVPRVTRVWNGYDGLRGRLVQIDTGPPPVVTVDVSIGYLRPRLQQGVVDKAIRKAAEQWRKVVTQSAKQRYARTLAEMGLRVPFDTVSVETTTLTYYPVWMALLQKGSQERIAAVDGTSGVERVDLGQLLTSDTQLVRH
jgi:hypothetical protein